ncbi:MAG: hypothetical protein WC325_13875 [Candidatus Bathyarchaeia archaeon]|jgi:hypothetical protein
MSAFSESQKQEIRLIIRAEFERYFNAALMYTESCKTRTVEHGEGTSKTFSQSPTPPPSTTPTPTDILTNFPADLRQYLAFKDDKIYSQYVSKEKWAQMNEEAEALGFTWVKAGKDSHWKRKA